MPIYRAFLMEKGSTTIVRSHNFIAPDATDASDALERAVRYVDGHDVELWEGETLIKRFDSDDPKTCPR